MEVMEIHVQWKTECADLRMCSLKQETMQTQESMNLPGKEHADPGLTCHVFISFLLQVFVLICTSFNIDLPYDPAIPCLGIYPKECNSGYSRGTCTSMFTAALFTIAKLWKQPRCPNTDKWIKKM
jgi:hypothetical protein